MGYLQAINRFSQADNLGGIITIQVARKAEITNINAPVNGIVYGDIDFVASAGFVLWQVTPETPGANSNTRTTKEGATKDNALKFAVPKDRSTLQAMFEQATEDEFVVLYKDANGLQKIFGSLDQPVKFRFSHGTGTSPAGKNGFDCEFYYDGPQNIYEYNGTIATAPAGPAPAIVNLNGTPIASLQPGQTLNITSDYTIDYFTITGP